MATKKEKRAAALAKREAMLAEVKAEGLRAQRLDQAYREYQKEQLAEKIDAINDRHREILAKHGIHE